MLRASAAARIDGGMVLRVQLTAKLAIITHTAGCASTSLDMTAERLPLACDSEEADLSSAVVTLSMIHAHYVHAYMRPNSYRM